MGFLEFMILSFFFFRITIWLKIIVKTEIIIEYLFILTLSKSRKVFTTFKYFF